jgi:hypothetical protein
VLNRIGHRVRRPALLQPRAANLDTKSENSH